ncbi:Polyketide synthase [Apiospora phragmitis]|uniref:Polyketide synthase n=1 Tax=Apiospora phragmitis TaxID=2905665 RepID=A0ABR1UU73_9PEZI
MKTERKQATIGSGLVELDNPALVSWNLRQAKCNMNECPNSGGSIHAVPHRITTRLAGLSGYLSGVSQKQTRLCLVLISATFKQLGCDLGASQPGDVL